MKDDLPHELKTLFEHALSEEAPSEADRSAVRRALAARLGAAAAAGAANTLSAGTVAAQAGASAAGITAATIVGKNGLAGVVLWLAVGATIGTGVSLATVAPTSSAPPSVSATPLASHPAEIRDPLTRRLDPAPAARPTVSTTERTEPASKADPAKPDSTSKKAKTLESAAIPKTESAPLSATALREETRALAAVQQALRDEQPDSALRLLEAQERTFPNGALHAERAAARVLALCAGHQVDAARAAAVQFLRDNPASPLADRIRSSCAK